MNKHSQSWRDLRKETNVSILFLQILSIIILLVLCTLQAENLHKDYKTQVTICSLDYVTCDVVN